MSIRTSPSSVTSDMSAKSDPFGDGGDDTDPKDDDDNEKVSSPKSEENRVQNGVGDDNDGSDDIFATLEENPDPDQNPKLALTYSDCLINGVPRWQIENRGMTEEEAEAWKKEVERLNKQADKGS